MVTEYLLQSSYDSLKVESAPDQWGRVLEVLMRFQSIGFIIAMTVGAAIYDPDMLTIGYLLHHLEVL